MNEILGYGHIENSFVHPHRSPGMKLVLVEKGRLEWAVNNSKEVLTADSIVFTLPWQVHGSLMLREPTNRIFYALFSVQEKDGSISRTLRFPSSLGFTREEEEALSTQFLGAKRNACKATPLLKELFPELVQRLEGTTETDVMAAASLLRTLLIELAGVIGRTQEKAQWLSPTERKVKRFLSSLADGFDQDWTLDKMAEQCGVKRTQLANITKQLTGYAPVQYLQRIRFDKACELLRDSEMSVTEIAFECGYSSSQYFAETFRKQARKSPSEYRRSVWEDETAMDNHWEPPKWHSQAEERASRQEPFATSDEWFQDAVGHVPR